jgi:hypothetical protein
VLVTFRLLAVLCLFLLFWRPYAGRVTTRAVTFWSMCCLLPLAGCGIADGVRPGATSILDVAAPPDPSDALKDASDPFRSELRYRGTQTITSLSLNTTQPLASREPALGMLRANLGDEDPGVRALASRALGTYGDASDAPHIALLLSDEDAGVRVEAARALQRLQDASVVDALLARLNMTTEAEAGVRLEAATALGQYRQTRVVEALIAALDDEHLGVNQRTLRSLRTLTGMDLGTTRATWQAWYRQQPSAQAVLAKGTGYVYPVYDRKQRWYEYIPLVPKPPNERPG